MIRRMGAYLPAAVVLAAGQLVSAFIQDQLTPSTFMIRSASDPLAPIVDVEYAEYQGYYNASYDINVYRG